LVQLYRWFPSVLKVITIIRPETVVLRIVRGQIHERADASHPIALLRARRERPRNRRAAKQCDELAASHIAPLPWHAVASGCFRVGLTRLINEQDIRTPQHIENRARNDPGILATNIKSVSRGLSSMRVMCLENGIRN
jgi:hypothetical protein